MSQPRRAHGKTRSSGVAPGGAAGRTHGAAARAPVAALGLALAWGAALLLAPADAGWGWALNGFRSVGVATRIGLLAAAAAVAAVTALAARRPRGRWTWLAVALGLALLLAFPLRERAHVLADTDLRLRSVEGFAAGTPGVSILEWSRRIHAAPLDLAVDLLIPVALVRAGLTAADAVACLSVLLALAFFAALARLLPRLGVAPGDRPAMFAALALAGGLLSFAGYAEVAGLVLVTVAWWWLALLAPLGTRGRAAAVALAWLAVLLAHRIGLVLAPVLLWRALGPSLPGDLPAARRWLLVFGALAAGAAWLGSSVGGGAAQVALDAELLLGAGGAPSVARSADLLNALLLVAPLALAAPFVAGGRALPAFLRDPRAWLLAVAALPLLAVQWLEMSAANGLGAYREWDLGVAAGMTMTVGAVLLLASRPGPRLRAGLLVLVPVLVLQAGSWLAVHADRRTGLRRAEALLPLLPPPQRGPLCLFLGQQAMDDEDPVLAARRYEQAFDLVPDPETGVLAATTKLMARDVEGARRLVARARATGHPLATTVRIMNGLDSIIVQLDRRAGSAAAPVAPPR